MFIKTDAFRATTYFSVQEKNALSLMFEMVLASLLKEVQNV